MEKQKVVVFSGERKLGAGQRRRLHRSDLEIERMVQF
jgi:hypothetical protein